MRAVTFDDVLSAFTYLARQINVALPRDLAISVNEESIVRCVSMRLEIPFSRTLRAKVKKYLVRAVKYHFVIPTTIEGRPERRYRPNGKCLARWNQLSNEDRERVLAKIESGGTIYGVPARGNILMPQPPPDDYKPPGESSP